MSLVSKPGYKESTVGWIPHDWMAICLSDICKPQQWPTISSQELASTGYPVYGANGRIGFYDSFNHENETVAITCRGATCGSVTLVPPKSYITGNAMCLDGIDPNRCFDHYLYQALVYRGFRDVITGSAQPQITGASIRKVSLALPPLPEQQKIAAILTAVDDKLNIIARQIEATQTLKRGLMQTLFSRGVGTQDTDGRWVPHSEFKDSKLGEIPVGWEVKLLGAITQESRARNAGSLDDALLCGVLKDQGLIPMRERVKGATTERCRIVEPNAFAYNPMRINIGSIARNLRDHAVMVSPDYVVFTAKAGELMYSYLDHFRRSDEWRRFVGRSGDGGVRIRIYYDDLAQLRMKVPPLKEQSRIVAILNCVSEKLNNLTTKQRKFQTLKRGLMQKLLTGEWRVKLDTEAAAA